MKIKKNNKNHRKRRNNDRLGQRRGPIGERKADCRCGDRGFPAQEKCGQGGGPAT